ncbi:MAG TPA: tripartite tricarboxylate transporter substrate binding protein [Burkholderiales bacterium]|nr:tripartite tricarboxylate transporter substrate binding protein [Burkholderiales bacterium]
MLRKIALWVFALSGTALAGGAAAQAYAPDRPIEFLVHTGPGGGSDVFARGAAAVLEKNKLVPQRIQITNKTGGGGLVAMSFLSEKAGQPEPVAFFTSVWYVNPLIRKEGKVTMNELTPIARLILEASVLTVRADSPFKNVKDFIEAARKNPGKLKQAGGSISGRDNNMRLLMQKATGTQWQFISFPGGGERIAALLGGHADTYVMEPSEALEHIRAGKIRVIAAVMDKRLAAFPDVPTLKEQGLNVPEIPQPRGVVGPPNMPANAKAYWEAVMAKMVKTPEWREFLKKDLLEDAFLTGPALQDFTKSFSQQMREILKEGGVAVVR